MTSRKLKLLIIPFFSTLLILSGTAQAKIVCWTNKDGVRECGNAVPPEYAQKERTTFNKQGRVTEVQERAKTKEELAADEVKRAEEEAKKAEEARLAAEEERRKQEQANYDRVLLATYLSVEDIKHLRDRQLSSIDATITITRDGIGKLQAKMDENKKKAADFERKGKPVPEELQQEIDSLQQQIDDKNAFIATKEQEKVELNKKYEAQITRFRELKGEKAASQQQQ